jgi:hypothetical protein
MAGNLSEHSRCESLVDADTARRRFQRQIAKQAIEHIWNITKTAGFSDRLEEQVVKVKGEAAGR